VAKIPVPKDASLGADNDAEQAGDLLPAFAIRAAKPWRGDLAKNKR
jgi:hypothetical protein